MTTAHEEYALTSYELQAIDYLVKPIPFPRFMQAVQRIINLKQNVTEQSNNENPSIFIKIDKKKLQKVQTAPWTALLKLPRNLKRKKGKKNVKNGQRYYDKL